MNIVITNARELIERYKGIDMSKIIEEKVGWIIKKGFEDHFRKIWIPEVKEDIILENLDYDEKKPIEVKQVEQPEQEEQEEYFDPKEFLYSKGANNKTGVEEYAINIQKIVNYFCEKYDFVSVDLGNKDQLFLYNGKYYEGKARGFIREKCEELLESYAKVNPINEIKEKIINKNYADRKIFEELNPNFIPLNNGVWDIGNKKLISHSPHYNFKTIIEIDYDKEATCPNWLHFLEETLYPQDIQVVQEWFGFQLLTEYLLKKAVILLGERDTGKTVFLEVLTNFIGERNKTGLSLQKISSGNDFVKLSLKDKYSNIYDDLSSKDMNDGGNFKVATGGGNISAEEKFGGFHQFRNYAKHSFATNKIPPVNDTDDMAYYSRWIVLRFDNVPDKLDLNLKKKLFKENQGILNWALEGLYRLLGKGSFSYTNSPLEVKKIMEMSGDQLIQFGEACLDPMEGGKVTKDQMYMVYSTWANRNKKPLLSKEQLGRRLNRKVPYLLSKRDVERYWANVKFKSDVVGLV